MKTLYEITTGNVGESYVRCYVWADSTGEATMLFKTKHPGENQRTCTAIFTERDASFCTALTDHGWPTASDVVSTAG